MAGGIKKNMEKGVKFLCIVVAIFFLVDAAGLSYTSLIKGDEFAKKAQSQQLSDTIIPAMRGTIYDSNGNVLAQSATVWDVFLDPYNIEDEETRQLVVNGLANILELDSEEKADLYETSKKTTRYEVVARKVETDVKAKLSEFLKKHKEEKLTDIIGTTPTSKRYYPYGSLASTVLGFASSEGKGMFGLELQYNEELSGTNGRIVTVKDAQSNKLPLDYQTSIDAVDGNSLVLTINQNIQYYLEKDLRDTLEEYQAKGAYGVVMDCKTGGVLAMASLPDYDLNAPRAITYSKYQKILDKITDEEKYKATEQGFLNDQWKNFTVQNIYEPGSVFKAFIASMALEENVVSLNDTYSCSGAIQVADTTFRCHKRDGHGYQTFTQGLENSCNPFFVTVGQKLGVHTLCKYSEAYGFTSKTGIDLPYEAKPDCLQEEKYGKVELGSASFGQTNSLTPIEVCTGLCAIANGGTLLKPYLVDEIRDADGNTIKKTQTTEVRRVISEDTSAKVRGMMKAVVDNGTGKNGYVAGYSVGGKTGTSTKLEEKRKTGKDKYYVSFAAIAPSDDPRVAMIIIVDEPNKDLGGGAVCAPIAARVVEQAMQEYNIEPRYTDKESKKLSINTPNVIGKTTSSAKSILQDKSLKCKIVGKGDTVISQYPSSNITIPSNGMVILYTEKDAKKKISTVPDFTGMTISEANARAAECNLNIEVSGNNLSSTSVVAYKQSSEKGSKVSAGTVITVTFKSTVSVRD